MIMNSWLYVIGAIVLIATLYELYPPLGLSLAVIALVSMWLR